MTRSPGIEAILFDAGGTLIHVDGSRFCAAAGLPFESDAFAAAEAAATAAVRSWILRHPESTDAERMPLFLDRFLLALGIEGREEREAAARRIAQEHQQANLWSGAAPGARETLATLRERGYRLGVVSNADGRVRKLLEVAGLGTHLEIILDSAHLGVEKPDPRIFLAATEALDLLPSACAYVGDDRRDVDAGRAAGMLTVVAAWGYLGEGDAPEAWGADHLIARPDELPGLIGGA